MDETCEIKATAFNAAVDDLYDKFEEGKVSLVIQEVERAHKSPRSTSCQKERCTLPRKRTPISRAIMKSPWIGTPK